MAKRTSSKPTPATSSLALPEATLPPESGVLSAHSGLQQKVASEIADLIQIHGFDTALATCLEEKNYPAIILLLQTKQAQGGK
jgi:hypothetical protein